jgi:UDP-2,3-diacylglucosamine hydrolase
MGKVYFASDFHLGIPNTVRSLEREKKLVAWLRLAAQDAECIYLVGDIFDFWFEYKHAVPRGYTRLLGTLSELCDKGIRIEVFTGNHDMWMFGYLEKECGVKLHRAPIKLKLQGKAIFLGHGDGLGPGDYGYKFLKRVFANRFCQWLFARMHPNFGIGLANFWSRRSRAASNVKDVFKGEENEWLLQYCRDYIKTDSAIDFFIFGHRHLLLDIKVNDRSRYVNLGDWFSDCNYAVLENGELLLKKYEVPVE